MAKDIAIVLLMLIGLVATASAANGYGTSNVIFAQSSVNIIAGNSAPVNYTVQLTSGNTWGTNLVVLNQNQLSSDGISITLSNPSGDPTFSGTLGAHTSRSTPTGSYNVVLQATGDDPSANATLVVVVAQPATTAAATTLTHSNSTTIGSTASSYSSITVVASNGSAAPVYSSGGGSIFAGATFLYAAIALIVIIALASLAIWKAGPTRLVIVGMALILIGVLIWLYGDYNGGLMDYIWGGVGAILLGTLLWVYGDFIAGAFRKGH